jgi:uncharacterized protein with PIN domain
MWHPMLYLDTSSLLKLLLPEPESPRVREAIAGERLVLVSALTELEAPASLNRTLIRTLNRSVPSSTKRQGCSPRTN